MTEAEGIHTKRKAGKLTYKSEGEERVRSATHSAHFSLLSTQEVSYKSSFDDLTNMTCSLSSEVLLSELAFPTGKVFQKLSQSSQNGKSPLYQPLSCEATSSALQSVSDLKRVMEILEADLAPVDVRAYVGGRKPAILMELPKNSTLLRLRRTR